MEKAWPLVLASLFNVSFSEIEKSSYTAISHVRRYGNGVKIDLNHKNSCCGENNIDFEISDEGLAKLVRNLSLCLDECKSDCLTLIVHDREMSEETLKMVDSIKEKFPKVILIDSPNFKKLMDIDLSDIEKKYHDQCSSEKIKRIQENT